LLKNLGGFYEAKPGETKAKIVEGVQIASMNMLGEGDTRG